MKPEIEVKFLNVDFKKLRLKLDSLGAVCMYSNRLMKRAILDTPNLDLKKKGGFVRVREEGNQTTLTYKQFDDSKKLHISSAKEIEVRVSNFEDTISILTATGLILYSMQESKRETWQMGDAEIMLDEWPWLKPYIEIEANTAELVKVTASILGFDWNDAVFGDVMAAYRIEYPHLTSKQTIGEIRQVKFSDPLPGLFKQVNK
jgi:adenylate cyclase class 2